MLRRPSPLPAQPLDRHPDRGAKLVGVGGVPGTARASGTHALVDELQEGEQLVLRGIPGAVQPPREALVGIPPDADEAWFPRLPAPYLKRDLLRSPLRSMLPPRMGHVPGEAVRYDGPQLEDVDPGLPMERGALVDVEVRAGIGPDAEDLADRAPFVDVVYREADGLLYRAAGRAQPAAVVERRCALAVPAQLGEE